MDGMTKKITVSLPDDVAERLASEDNASAYVTDAVRRSMIRETTHAILAQSGVVVTEEGKDRARAAYQAATARALARRAQRAGA